MKLILLYVINFFQQKEEALHKAAEFGHIHACRNLLEFGADPYAKDIVSDHAELYYLLIFCIIVIDYTKPCHLT